VLINIVGIKTFGRADLTRDDQFTLASATQDTLRLLHDPVTVKAYFSKNMPPPFSTNARYVRDLLEEYYARSDGYFRFEFIDPLEEETAADKEKKKDVKQDIFGRAVREATSVETELQSLGIPPRQVQVREEDKVEVKRAYMGIAIHYGDKTEVIPVVSDTTTLEYDMTTLMRKLTRERAPKVVLASSSSEFNPAESLGRVHGLLTQLYDVQSQSIGASIDEGTNALVLVGGESEFSEEARKAVDAFLATGGSVAMFLDKVKPDLRTLEAKPAAHGLGDQLKTYGITIGDGLVLDAECATISVQQQRGFMRISQPVPYPYMPIAKGLDPDHPVTRRLGQIAFPFMSPLTVKDGIDAKVLATSSEQGWIAQEPFNMDPMQRWTQDSVGAQGVHNLVVTVTGALAPHYPDSAPETAKPARLLVAGGSAFLDDQFLNQSGQAFVLNMMDWLLLDDALLAMRSRGIAALPLEEMGDGTRSLIKVGNIAGLPLCFVAFGMLRWRARESRRGKVTLS
jgi:gliding-associated putative ABC transporter substrate-binding component GldG